MHFHEMFCKDVQDLKTVYSPTYGIQILRSRRKEVFRWLC